MRLVDELKLVKESFSKNEFPDMNTKDFFSGHANVYASFRPEYPEALYQFIFKFVQKKNAAWDCGTGNGQVARRLAQSFTSVYATDISKKQLEQAKTAPNIFYSVASAESTAFPPNTFDLITVAQALHWFDTEAFFAEAKRVAQPSCTFATWGYGNISINDTLDPYIHNFYTNVVGKYWDEARRHVETEYRNIPFPFKAIDTPQFYIELTWNLAQLKGYLESWSATQRYIKELNENPVIEFSKTLEENWGNDELLAIRFPIFLKLGVSS
jgi:trans-aconitate methyltransferase